MIKKIKKWLAIARVLRDKRKENKGVKQLDKFISYSEFDTGQYCKDINKTLSN